MLRTVIETNKAQYQIVTETQAAAFREAKIFARERGETIRKVVIYNGSFAINTKECGED